MSRTFAALATVFALTCIVAGCPAHAEDFKADFHFDREFRSLFVLLDRSHDLVHIDLNGDNVEITVMMFDPDQFLAIPAISDPQELEELAAEVDDCDVPLDELGEIYIACEEGHDFVWTAETFPVPLVIDGGDGDDVIYGGDGNDYLEGGDGADYLYGRGGYDSLAGFSGSDYLYGGDEGDELYGGPGLDRLFGEAGGDRLEGSKDGVADILTGGAGPDEFFQYSLVSTYFYTNPLGSSLSRASPSTSGSLEGRLIEAERIVDKTAEDSVTINDGV